MLTIDTPSPADETHVRRPSDLRGLKTVWGAVLGKRAPQLPCPEKTNRDLPCLEASNLRSVYLASIQDGGC